MVRAHLQEAAIVAAVLADEDRLDRRLHVVVDAAPAGTLEEGEAATIVRVEDHLLALARIGAHEHHAAVAEPEMSHLHGHRRAADQHDVVAPVELVGLARCEGERDEGLGRVTCMRSRPKPGRSGEPRRSRPRSPGRVVPRTRGSASGARELPWSCC